MRPSTLTKGGLFSGLLCLCLTASAQPQRKARLQSLHAQFAASVQTGCAPLVVRFSDASAGNPTQWQWDLGNGVVSTQQNPATIYNLPGTYTVRLVVRTSSGADSLAKTAYIRVAAAPSVQFSLADSTGCAPLRVSFTDASTSDSAILSRVWDFGDGSFGNGIQPQHTYTQPGNYNITLKVTNSAGCTRTLSRNGAVRVVARPVAAFTSSNTTRCAAPLAVQFEATGSPASTYQWSFGDGSSDIGQYATHIYTGSGAFGVQLVVTNSAGCTDTIRKASLVNIGSVTTFTAPDTVCVSAAVPFTDLSVPAAPQRSWYFGDGNSSIAAAPLHVYTTPGQYRVKLLNEWGDCSDSAFRTITVLPRPRAAFETTDTTACQLPHAVHFQNDSQGAASYDWDFGDGSSSTDAAPTHLYTTPGTFTVRLIVRGLGGCTDTLTRSHYVSVRIPQISVAGIPASGCAPLAVSLMPIVTGADSIVSWSWNFGDGQTSTDAHPSYTYGVGVYTVQLTATTLNGCTVTRSFPQAIHADRKPQALFTFTPPVSCAIDGVSFTSVSTGIDSNTTYHWDFGDGSTSSLQNPVASYSDTGVFNVTLIVRNGTCADTLRQNQIVRILPPIARFRITKNCDDRLLRGFEDRSLGAESWQWDFGDGTSSADRNPQHHYSGSGTYTVILTVTNGSCINKSQVTIEICDEHARFVKPAAPVCRGTEQLFMATGIDASRIAGWLWEFGDGVTASSAQSARHVFTTNGLHAVKLTITDLNGCTSEWADTVDIQGPVADFGADALQRCLQPGGVAFVFTDRSTPGTAAPVTAWNWSFGDGQSASSGGVVTHVYGSRGVYDVALTVRDANGCTDTKSVPAMITVSKPMAGFVSADTNTCTARPVGFVNQSAGATSYSWSFGDGATATADNPVHAYTATGQYTITLTAIDAFGCSDTLVRPQYISISLPRARFALSDSIGNCPPLSVSFTNLSGNFTDQRWDFGDGSGSVLAAPAHIYNTAGTFYPRLVVTGPGGCTDTVVHRVVVKGPSGSFTASPAVGCLPLAVQFTATTLNRDSLVWDFGDGTVLAGLDSLTVHTYFDTGRFVPRLILSDGAGCSVTLTAPDTIRAYRIFPAATASGNSFCGSGTVQFTGASVGNTAVSGWHWDFGDGTISTAQNPLHQYANPGTYVVRLTNSSIAGCEATAPVTTVRIHRLPELGIRVTDTAACLPARFGLDTAFLRADTTIRTWSWQLGDGRTLQSASPGDASYAGPGSFLIRLTATDNFGCTGNAEQLVHVWPVPNVDAGPAQTLCRDSFVRLQAAGAAVYQWQASPALSCTGCAAPEASNESDQVFYVTGTDVHGCKASDSVFVKVQQPIRVLPGLLSDSLCRGSSVYLPVTGGDRYQWSPSAGLDLSDPARPRAMPDTTTTYSVVALDAAGCFADTARIQLTVFPVPQVSLPAQIDLRAGDTLTLRPTVSADVTEWRWTPSGQLSCNTCPEPIVRAGYSSPLRLLVRNPGGCTALADTKLQVLCDGADVFLPNTFSPNKDGMNDRFYPRGKGLTGIRSFRIYNRWGEVVFERLSIKANNASEGWDGSFKGSPAPSDVYLFTCEVTCSSGVVMQVKGDLTLLR